MNNKQFCILFVINLSIGLTGLISIEGFKSSLNNTISEQSKSLLGADVGMSARRPITDQEIKVLEAEIKKSNFQFAQMIEVFSMVKSENNRSRLMQIRAIDGNYPFYGEFKLRQKTTKTFKKNYKERPLVLVHPEVLDQLGAKIGQTIKIGAKAFTISNVVEQDSASGVSSSVAPRIYMHLQNLSKTKLLKFGSLAWYSQLYKIPHMSDSALEELSDSLFEKLDSPELQIYTHKRASEQLSALVSRLNDFLGLNSIVALFLSFIGGFFLVRSYFFSKFNQIAILISLGLSPALSFLFYIFQILILGLCSSILASILSLFVVPVLGKLSEGLLPFTINFSIDPITFIYGLIVGVAGSALICLPLIVKLKKTKPLLLLSNQLESSKNSVDLLMQILWSVPALLLFYFLSVRLSNSIQVGSYFILIVLSASVILAGLSSAIFREPKNRTYISLFWALREIKRNRKITLISFIAIGIGSLLLNLTPQISAIVKKDLVSPDQKALPTFFMFDIQEEQVGELKNIATTEGAKINNLSPVIRARLSKVNELDFGKGIELNSSKNLTREQQRELRFKNRGFNLSYRDRLDSSESIFKGQNFSGFYDETTEILPEISVERRFAKRLELKIGDTLDFEIDGLPFSGRVINLRSVKWSSFQPNFFLQFQPGSLDMAPKTFVASINTDSYKIKMSLQNTIVEQLPNVSIVDVSKVVTKIIEIMTQMVLAIQFMSIICILVGFIVIYSVANHLAVLKKQDIGLLKAVGVPLAMIRNQFLFQFGIIALVAASFGVCLSLLASLSISYFVFQTKWVVSWPVPVASTLGVVGFSILVTYLGVRKSLNTKALKLLNLS